LYTFLEQEILQLQYSLNHDSALQIIELGRELHQESKFKDTPFSEQNCWKVLEATQTNQFKFFLAYDDEFRGFIIMQATTHYFNNNVWTADLAFYVKPEFRGTTTVGLELLQEAEKWSKAIGAQEMTIFHNTGINTDKSEKFFNRNGFSTAGYIFTKEL
jgi:hypothetical protein